MVAGSVAGESERASNAKLRKTLVQHTRKIHFNDIHLNEDFFLCCIIFPGYIRAYVSTEGG